MNGLASFKICRCCGTEHGLRRRVCRQCKVLAIWDKPTAEQQAEHDASINAREALIQKLTDARTEQVFA